MNSIYITKFYQQNHSISLCPLYRVVWTESIVFGKFENFVNEELSYMWNFSSISLISFDYSIWLNVMLCCCVVLACAVLFVLVGRLFEEGAYWRLSAYQIFSSPFQATQYVYFTSTKQRRNNTAPTSYQEFIICVFFYGEETSVYLRLEDY